MNSENLIKQFDEIETKVERVLSTLQTIEAENVELKRQVRKLEDTLGQKEAAASHFSDEKRQIRERVDILLNKLGDFSRNNA